MHAASVIALPKKPPKHAASRSMLLSRPQFTAAVDACLAQGPRCCRTARPPPPQLAASASSSPGSSMCVESSSLLPTRRGRCLLRRPGQLHQRRGERRGGMGAGDQHTVPPWLCCIAGLQISLWLLPGCQWRGGGQFDEVHNKSPPAAITIPMRVHHTLQRKVAPLTQFWKTPTLWSRMRAWK